MSPQPSSPAAGNPCNLAVLLATRGRPEMLAQVFASLAANTTRKDQTALWLYVDEDDTITRDAIAKKQFPDTGFLVHWHIGPRIGNVAETFNILLQQQDCDAQLFITAVDDARFDTQGWDEIIRAKYRQYPDGVMLAFAHDPMSADAATYVIFSQGWVKTLGRAFPSYFPHWFPDTWVDQVGRMAGRHDKLPILLYPIRGKGRTKLMRNLPFWSRFFQLTLGERKEAARRIVHAIHPENSPARTAALAQLETVAAELLKNEERFSDLYCAFQEERHAELSTEERAAFNPAYFRHEAQAVSRLILLGQEQIERKQYEAAMNYLAGTHYSDLRVRQVQLLKAQCLRALGREAEANAVSQEIIAAWPQMTAARRLFRFLGMVANDGKRMLVGLTEKGRGGKK
jgi:hypothetical protein